MKFIEQLKLSYRANKYKNKKDKGEIAYLLENVKSGESVMDIGAHKAGYLYFMRKRVGDKGHVYAFEPQSKLLAYLTRLKQLLHWENVTLEHIALSDAKDTATLYIPGNSVSEGSSPSASIYKNHGEDGRGHVESVQTNTLDDYCTAKNIQPSFLKIDVEGNELKVFKGGERILKEYRPKVLVEIEEQHVGRQQAQDTLDYMLSLGYRGYFFDDTKRRPLSEFRFEQHQNKEGNGNYCNNFIFE